MAKTPTPAAVRRALSDVGEDLATWRRLRNLTITQVADRAGVARSVVLNLEAGSGATLESTLRVARALGILEALSEALDPYRTDIGRLRSEETLPQRVRHRALPSPPQEST
jgi:transcriptional regulator with XRE-family HTH domain